MTTISQNTNFTYFPKFSNISTDCEKQLNSPNILKMSEILNEIQKKSCEKKFLMKEKINLSNIQMDYLETIKINHIDGNNISIGSIISLEIDDNELILHVVTEETQTKPIDIMFPINLSRPLESCKLSIYNPTDYTDLNNNYKFKYTITATGFDITNKELFDVDTSIIKLDHNKIYSNAIHDIQINKGMFEFVQFNTFDTIEQIQKHETMSNLMKHLEQPSEKRYCINNVLDLNLLNNFFQYFYWVKIVNKNNSKLEIGTKIDLIIGSDVVLSKTITTDTIFDDNYFKFDIDFPNSKLYKYHQMKLVLSQTDNFYHIIVSGSKFKSTMPKSNLNVDYRILFDHDTKWYEPEKRMFISCCGMIGNIAPNQKIEAKCNVLNLFKEYEKKYKIYYETMNFSKSDKEICVFIDNVPFENDNGSKHLQFFTSRELFKYLQQNDHVTNYLTYGINLSNNNVTSCFSEFVEIKENNNDSVISMCYPIFRSADLLRHIDIVRNNIDPNSDYDVSVQLECDQQIIYDFGSINIKNLQRLLIKDKYINLVGKSEKSFFLVIQAPFSKYEEIVNINIVYGFIFSDSFLRRKLAYDKMYTDFIAVEN